MKKAFLLAFVLVSFSLSILGTGLIITVGGSATLHVYSGESIQEAVNSAQQGDTIFVHAGTYSEHVVINKTLLLVGENRDSTIIDGGEMVTPVVHVTANNVTFTAFTIQNGGRIYGWEGGGIYVTNSSRNNIINNTIENTQYGINLMNSTNNIITANTIMENDVGTQFIDNYSNNSVIYHNNFIDNGWQVNSFAPSNNTWDNGYPSGGNYWSNYTSTDFYSGPYQNGAGSDGIGDTPYVIDENDQDNYPLMHPYGSIRNLDTNLTYLTIQSAIDAIETLDGHTIFVEEGVYCENLVVNKSLSLIGRDRDSTIVYGNNSAYLVNVEASNAKITGFTLKGFSFANIYVSGANGVTIKGNRILFIGAGIDLHNSNNSVITSNIIEGCGLDNIGIIVVESSKCIIENNTISGAVYDGIRLIWSADNNMITSNTISNNDYGIHIIHSNTNTIINNTIADNSNGIFMEKGEGNTVVTNTLSDNWAAISSSFSSIDNVIYHNNFFNNTHQIGNPLHSDPLSSNRWDNGLEGNYWSDYTGQDANLDGIGDVPYIVDGDNYPLMGMFYDFPISSIVGHELEETFHISIICNSTVTDPGVLSPIINLETGEWGGGEYILEVAGSEGTKGFCRFTIPKNLLNAGNGSWGVYVDGTRVTSSCNIWDNSTHTFIYVPYNHSILEIMIFGWWIIPEFPAWTSTLLILMVLSVSIAIYKRRLLKTPKH